MKDERIQNTVHRFAAGGFLILMVLLWISLMYRMLILKQPLREFWDIPAILCFGFIFVCAACANKGVYELADFKKQWWIIGITLIIVVPATHFFMGRIQSVGDVAGTLIGLLIGLPIGLGLFIGITHFLKRRWERKEGIEGEE